MKYYRYFSVIIEHLKSEILPFFVFMTVIIDCDVTMSEIYQAKYSFRGLEDVRGLYEKLSTKSIPNSPSPTRNTHGHDNNNKITSDQLVKLNKCFAKMATDAILRSPILSVKLEKCNSEPNVSKDIKSGNSGNTSIRCPTSPCHSSKSEHSLAGISISHLKQIQNNLFLAFEEGDTFEVLSKDEHVSWWAVRALKSDSVGFVPVTYLNHAEQEVTLDPSGQDKKEANLRVVSELRKRIADITSQGEFFPRDMIPEPELCNTGEDLEKRNRRNNAPIAPPLPLHNPEGLIVPRKPQNPYHESSDHKNLHRELLFNQKIGKNVLNQKSELQRALEKHKEHQVKKELEQQKQESKSALERVIEERAKRLETLEKPEEEEKCETGEPEFMKIHAKLRARMDSK